MNITLENIDELRQRANVGYKESKEALVECDGDMVEALIYIEEKFGVKQNKVSDDTNEEPKKESRKHRRHEYRAQIKSDSLTGLLKKFIDYCNSTRLIIFNQYRTVIDVPLTLAIIMGMLLNVFAVMIIVTAIVTDHKIKLVRTDDGANEINNIIDKVQKAAHDVTETIKTNVNMDFASPNKSTEDRESDDESSENKKKVNLDK